MKNFLLKRMALAAIMIVAGVVGVHADDGDILIVKTQEGVKMTFEVISEYYMECRVGLADYDYGDGNCCIDKSTTGTVTIPEKVQNKYRVVEIGPCAFQYSNVEEVVIPYTVERIGKAAFYQCANLKKCWLPKALQWIKQSTFRGCKSLEDVYIPEGVRWIDGGAFISCEKLDNVVIPKTVEEIQDAAFMDCSGLYYITFMNTTPPWFGNQVFFNTPYADYGDGKIYSMMNIAVPNREKCAYDDVLPALFNCDEIYVQYGLEYAYGDVRDRETMGYMVKLWFNYNETEKKYKVDYMGALEEIKRSTFTVPASLLGYDVTGVYAYEYGNWYDKSSSKSSLTQVVIPSTVKTIAQYAFNKCDNLAEIQMAEGLEDVGICAFANTAITELHFPTTMKRLGLGTVQGCNNLTDVYMPVRKVISYMDEYKVRSMSQATLHVPFGSLKNYQGGAWETTNSSGNRVYEYDLIAEEDAKDGDIFSAEYKSGKDMWFQVMSAKDKTCRVYGDFPAEEKMKAVDPETEGSVNIPSKPKGFSVVEVGDDAFFNLAKITNVSVPNGVKRIGESVFALCSSLVSVNLPASLETIGLGAFSWNASLASINLPEGLKSIGEAAFGLCPELYSITLPSTLEEIGPTAFAFTSLQEVDIPAGIGVIPASCFSNCTNLQSVTIPEGIHVIGRSAFDACSSLETLELPVSVGSLGYKAFYGCNGLKDVYIGNSHVQLFDSNGNESTDNDAFAYTGDYRYATLHVPAGSESFYDWSPWTTWFWVNYYDLDNIPTGIDTVATETDTQSPWYSIDGTRLNSKPTKPGMYIQNGKKTIVK